MAFFRVANHSEAPPLVRGDGVVLRTPQMADFARWSALREESRAFLAPWEPVWPVDDLTRSAYRRRLRRYADDLRADLSYAFFICRAEDDGLLGGLTLTNVRRGVAQSATLGYWMGERYAGKGVMTAAVAALIPFVFGALRLHRLEAACIPTNIASISLLKRNGFVQEGYAREYLCINGSWQDHLLFARLDDR